LTSVVDNVNNPSGSKGCARGYLGEALALVDV
jgi:hypothetical protein